MIMYMYKGFGQLGNKACSGCGGEEESNEGRSSMKYATKMQRVKQNMAQLQD